jgi:4-hydroxy-tetrahydrodipicolinate synthase
MLKFASQVKEISMFRGSIPALVTPFRDEAFVEAEFRTLIDWQIDEGSAGLVPCGTTGESATMLIEEHDEVVRVCVEQAAGRVPVIAGCGSNDTKVALSHMQHAKQAGASAALVVLPYYNRPNQEGLYAHFSYLAERCDLPIILYNVPTRTVTDVEVATLARLVEAKAIMGIKDASGDLSRVTAQRLACGESFVQLSGNDDIAFGFLAMGGAGTISVTANVAPRLFADFHEAMAAADHDRAIALQDRLFPLHKALFSDASPGPVKYALSRVRPGFPAELRLPMTPPSEASCRAIDAALEHAGLV